MCTLILGRDELSPRTILLAANRDEDPGRPSDPPGVLGDHPLLVGGRDRRAGGTWLVVREARAVVAILNRRDPSGLPAPPSPDRRSRGTLALEVAGVDQRFPETLDPTAERRAMIEQLRAVSGPGLPHAALCRAFAALWQARYAPFTLLYASPAACWLLAHDDDAARPQRVMTVPPGWHALTHADLDDPDEPRTARLSRELAGFAPRSVAKAEQRLGDLLRSHGDAAVGTPPVCLHAGRMVTVSASIVWLAENEARYHHAEGRPCTQPFEDCSHLLRAGSTATGRG